MQQIQLLLSLQQTKQRKALLEQQIQWLTLSSQHVHSVQVSNMCVECGCNKVGSETGIASVEILDRTNQGAAGNIEE
jgi:hypothetical protein